MRDRMTPDPRWLEILKASGWQTTALATAFGLFLLAAHIGWLPPLDPWMLHLAALAFLVCMCLALASMGSAAIKIFPVQKWLVYWMNTERKKKEIRKYIPHMTEDEKAIIAYLLARNQKVFTVESDGGHAVTLMSMGIVVRAGQPGQMFRGTDMPVAIPDYIWDVLEKHKDQFPYTPRNDGRIEAHPWRVHWMAR
jgi:hypothetical protein